MKGWLTHVCIRGRDFDALSSIVELDFTQCHALPPAASWRCLADSSPAVEALALPSCALSTTFQPGNRPPIDADITKAIARLKLKKLHITGASRSCTRSSNEVTGRLAAQLSNCKHLEELSLNKLRLSRNFFARVKGPLTMRTIRLSVDFVYNDSELPGFLSQCENLRSLKLEASDLPLTPGRLWYALSKRSLKQLCISSAEEGPAIDPGKFRPYVGQLFRTLDVFHLRARNHPNVEEIEALVEEEARLVNFGRGVSPLRFNLERRSVEDGGNFHDAKVAGRSLCCMDSFIGVPKPIGWDVAL